MNKNVSDIQAEQPEFQAQLFVKKTAEILEMIAKGQPASAIYDAIALMYEGRNPGMRCSLLELKDDKLMHGGAPSLPKEYCDAVNGLKFGPSVGSCGTSTYTGKRVLVENIETDPKWSEIKHVALPHGMRCCWSEPIKDSNGKVLGAFGMYYNYPALPDEDKLADLQSAARLAGIIMERDQRETVLRKSEYKYRMLFENMAQGGFYQEPDGTLIDFNQNALKMFGLTKDQFLGRTSLDPEWKVIHEDGSDYPGDKHPSMVALKTGKPVLNKIAGVFNTKKKEYVWLNINAIPQFKDGETKPYQVFVTLHDISELKKAEENLRQAHKMESIGTLAGGIAHDFNNILYMILGNIDLVLQDIPKWNPVYESIEEVKSAGLRASAIVKQLLSFSRKAEQKFRAIGAVTVINDGLNFIRSTLPSTIRIKKELPDHEIPVLGDPVMINQMLINICTNAAQSMEQTGGKLKIKVKKIYLDKNDVKNHQELSQGQYLKIKIKDTGPGIDPSIIDKIFDPYFTTKDVGEGSGMGLAIVHGIIVNHNGAISVKSKLDKGSLFTILIPVTDQKTEIKLKEEKVITQSEGSILFVDDEKSIITLGEKTLERLGYEVEATSNPQMAIEKIHTNPQKYNLIITDMTMPQMTGVQLAEKVKEIRPDIPIIICTGYSSLINEKKAKELNINGFLMKPVSWSKLEKMINEILFEA